MYKLLLADDENIILESISRMVDWEKHGLALIGTAQNGLEAYQKILEHKPHIVITDIKMPGMSGLELMKAVREKLPDTVFIILSGYGEFDFASKAIEYGVKHYLLKPCDEVEIVPVIRRIVEELNCISKKKNFIKETEESLEKVIPQVKEQFLRDLILNRVSNPADRSFFQNLFHISKEPFKLVLFKPEEECDFIEKFALKKLSEEILAESGIRVFLGTVLEENVLLLINSADNAVLFRILEVVKENYSNYYGIGLTIAISRENSFDRIPGMYTETQECLQYSFYSGEGSILSRDDIFIHEGGNYSLNYDFNKIAMAVKTGSLEQVASELDYFFEKIGLEKMESNLAKSYCMDLFQFIVRQCRQEEMGLYLKKMTEIQAMDTLRQIKEFIDKNAVEITRYNYNSTSQKYSLVVKKTIGCIEENIQNQDLSLTWVAKEILFMNENYLGRLFYKETGEKFSQYVMKVRIEKAKKLLESSNNYKVYEICELIGFSDPQYFSQAFKRSTGLTPTEYKKN